VTAPRGSRLGTVSLRRRVTVATVTVFVAVLVAVIVIVNSAFTVIINRSVATVLNEQTQLATELAAHNTPPAVLVARLETRSVRVRLNLPDGRVLGNLEQRPLADRTVRARRVRLSAPSAPLNGSELTVALDGQLIFGARTRVLRVLIIVAVVAAVLVAVTVPLVVRRALSPLDDMTRLARGVAGGRRGERLWPDAADTELGRTVAAFDDMLDALEGAEQRALSSESAMRRFVADAAHELRTPIAGIAAAAEAALQNPDGDLENRQRLLVVLGREAHHAGRLIEDLLDLARIDTGLTLHPEDTDIRHVAVQQVERARLLHPDLSLRVEGPSVTVNVDAARIGQVLANLLNNACEVTHEGGTIRVVVSQRGRGVVVSVHDDGPGVPVEDQERIFGRLIRLNESRGRRGEGAGLGLTIARGIARAHGGDVTCEPPSGTAGAVFALWLPVHRHEV
jgi:two-component system OmpR family sensor kinase